MTEGKIINGRPQLAIIDSNTLAVLGLKQILQNVMPVMDLSLIHISEPTRPY